MVRHSGNWHAGDGVVVSARAEVPGRGMQAGPAPCGHKSAGLRSSPSSPTPSVAPATEGRRAHRDSLAALDHLDLDHRLELPVSLLMRSTSHPRLDIPASFD